MGRLTFHQKPFPALLVDCQGERITALAWQCQREKGRGQNAVTGTRAERALLHRLRDDLERYFAGEAIHFNWPLDWSAGTDFQRRVWRALQKVPYGETRSYQWVAEQIGQTQAVRAVGQANGANPFSLVVPCHRIIQKSGALGGYASGSQIKRQLLKLEKK